MTRPKFANTEPSSSRRPKASDIPQEEAGSEVTPKEQVGLFVGAAPVAAGSIAKYMEQRMQERMREPSRAITLRFEESIYQKVETLRGSLTKNDFFKELVRFYEMQHNGPSH